MHIKINCMLFGNAEDLNFVMLMHSLIECSKSYRKATGSLWDYYRDDLNDDTNNNNSPNKKVIE